MPNEVAHTHEKPVVAVGSSSGGEPRLLTLDELKSEGRIQRGPDGAVRVVVDAPLTLSDTGRAAVIDALAAFDGLPADMRDSEASYAHRVVIRDALAACGYPVSTGVAVSAARDFLGVPSGARS